MFFYLDISGKSAEIISGMLEWESEIELRDFCPDKFSCIEYPTTHVCYCL